MPLVFVHGVNVRNDAMYEKQVRNRDSLFRRFVLRRVVAKADAVTILNPYWGDHAAKLAWNHASLPRAGVEAFGPSDSIAEVLLGEVLTQLPEQVDESVLTVAQGSLPDAVDLLWGLAASSASDDEVDGVTELSAEALDYAARNPKPDWLRKVRNDREFSVRLKQEIGGQQTGDGSAVESFGAPEIWGRVGEALSRVAHGLSNAGTDLLLAASRRRLHAATSIFLGDVFVYLQDRGDKDNPGPIVQCIVDTLDKAVPLCSCDDPLIIVAHSMGGNIVYDVLTHFRPDIACDALVTVGSQVALFEELKLFKLRDLTIPRDAAIDRMPKPTNVEHWLNVYDTNDVLAFAAGGVFKDVSDLDYSTGKGFLSAHSTYFLRPSFHERMGRRLEEILS